MKLLYLVIYIWENSKLKFACAVMSSSRYRLQRKHVLSIEDRLLRSSCLLDFLWKCVKPTHLLTLSSACPVAALPVLTCMALFFMSPVDHLFGRSCSTGIEHTQHDRAGQLPPAVSLAWSPLRVPLQGGDFCVALLSLWLLTAAVAGRLLQGQADRLCKSSEILHYMIMVSPVTGLQVIRVERGCSARQCGAVSSQLLETSMHGDGVASLGNMSRCWTVLMGKRLSLYPFPSSPVQGKSPFIWPHGGPSLSLLHLVGIFLKLGA